MSKLQAQRRKQTQVQPAAGGYTEERVREQLSAAAGTEAFAHRDPMYHLTESFRQTFDIMGQQRARGETPDQGAMLEVYMRDETPGLWSARLTGGPEPGETESGLTPGEENADQTAFARKTSMNDAYEPRDWDPRNRLLNRFADVTFQRGKLSAAVVQGTGKMMLFSCLERTAGQERSLERKERKLFQRESVHRMIPGRREDMGIVNRGFTDSAVGLVVDVLKDARQVLDSLTAMAEGKSGIDAESGVGTLRKQYPFLTDDREQALLEEYGAKLEELKGPGHEEERQVLLRAQAQARAMIAKKEQMKEDFLQKLRQLSYNALSAQALFSQETFLAEAARRVSGEEEPEDAGEPTGDDSGADSDADREPEA